MRTFVSVDFPELTDGIKAVQSRFGDPAGLRFTDPDQAHVTLKFLGEIDEGQREPLQDALATAVDEADVGPFEAQVAGLGAFPSRDYISVVWLGVDDGGAMARLHEEIETQATALGFEPADHDFTPHVTIARMDHAGGKDRVQRVLDEYDPVVGTASVSVVHLTKSTLTDDGPVYESLQRFAV